MSAVLRKRRIASAFALGALVLSTVATTVSAQNFRGRLSEEEKEKLNANRVGLVAGLITGSYLRLANDIARLIDDLQNLEMRVLVMVGKGSVQNITDLLNVRGVDIAIVQADALDFLQQQPGFEDARARIGYITQLYREEIHILARDGIGRLSDLAGKRVNIESPNTGTHLTSKLILDVLGLLDHVRLTEFDSQTARDMLLDGKLDAMVNVTSKPVGLFREIAPERAKAERLGFVALPASLAIGGYVPGELTARDYDNLIEPGRTVPIRTVPSVLAAYRWPPGHPRQQAVAKFTRLFFDAFPQLAGPVFERSREKWCEVDLGDPVLGWTRIDAATEWLKQNRGKPARLDCGKKAAEAAPAGAGAPTCEQAFRTALQQRGQAADGLDRDAFAQALAAWRQENPGRCG